MKVEHQKSTTLSSIRFVDVYLSKGKWNAILSRTDVLMSQTLGQGMVWGEWAQLLHTVGNANDVTSNKICDYIPSWSTCTPYILGVGLGAYPSRVHRPVKEAYFNPAISLQFIMEFMMILI